jgi:hypothetical protein
MSSQHLSDEAVAAFADAVLTGAARERATRHVNGCPECGHAVAVQREAITALRAASAPALPGGRLDRLKHHPSTTPLDLVPTAMGPDGSTVFATFGSPSPSGRSVRSPFGSARTQFAAAVPFGAAALVPAQPVPAQPAPGAAARRGLGHGPMAFTVAALAAAGVLAAGSVSHDAQTTQPVRTGAHIGGAAVRQNPSTYVPDTGFAIAGYQRVSRSDLRTR